MNVPILRRARHHKIIILHCPNYLKNYKGKIQSTLEVGAEKKKKLLKLAAEI